MPIPAIVWTITIFAPRIALWAAPIVSTQLLGASRLITVTRLPVSPALLQSIPSRLLDSVMRTAVTLGKGGLLRISTNQGRTFYAVARNDGRLLLPASEHALHREVLHVLRLTRGGSGSGGGGLISTEIGILPPLF